MELKLGSYRLQFGKEYHIDGTKPKIYNAEGNLLETYFIRNRHSQHAPYGHEGKYFFWDRYNYGLDTHFYGPEMMPHMVATSARGTTATTASMRSLPPWLTVSISRWARSSPNSRKRDWPTIHWSSSPPTMVPTPKAVPTPHGLTN